MLTHLSSSIPTPQPSLHDSILETTRTRTQTDLDGAEVAVVAEDEAQEEVGLEAEVGVAEAGKELAGWTTSEHRNAEAADRRGMLTPSSWCYISKEVMFQRLSDIVGPIAEQLNLLGRRL